MKRYLITNPKFTGAGEIIYNETGILIIVDLSNCGMSAERVNYFLKIVPTLLDHLLNHNPFTHETLIIESEVVVTFEMFWTAYQKKINRKRAEGLWIKLSKMEQVQAYSGVKPYIKFLQKESWRNKADADTYIRDKMYQNEYK